jgi:hypothetical protein
MNKKTELTAVIEKEDNVYILHHTFKVRFVSVKQKASC